MQQLSPLTKIVASVIGSSVVLKAAEHLLTKGIDLGLAPKNKGDVGGLPREAYQDLPKLEAPAGYVCLFQDVNDSKYCKIGRAGDPAAYIDRELRQTASEIEVFSVFEHEDAEDFLRDFHQHFYKKTDDGMWYKLSAADRREIDLLRNSA